MTAAVPDPQEESRARAVETVILNGQNVTVAEVPDLPGRGLTSLTYDYRQRIQVRSVDDLDGRVLLHEFLHALLRTDPQQVCPAADDQHEQFVRMLTAGLHDALGYRRTAAPDPRFRDQLAEVTGCAPLADSGGAVWCETHGEDWPCEVGRIEAVVEARVQAAANQRAVETLSTDLTWLSEWVNAGNAHRDPEAVLWSRVLKVSEEVGEVYAALSGAVGENPRKGFTHSMDDVQDELLDVASAALCAVEHLRSHDGRAVHVLAERVDRTVARARAAALEAGAGA